MIIALLSILYRKVLRPLLLRKFPLNHSLILALLLALCYACRNTFLHSVHFNKIKIMKNSPSRKDDQEEELYEFPDDNLYHSYSNHSHRYAFLTPEKFNAFRTTSCPRKIQSLRAQS